MPARSIPNTDRPLLAQVVNQNVRAALILMAVVFAACIMGIYSRPIGFLANVWPANPIMLALLIRMPGAATPLGWLSGAMAYLAADLMTGATLFKAGILNLANLVGIATAYLLYRSLPSQRVRLEEPGAMLLLMLVAAAGAFGAGLVGGVANPLLFNGGIFQGFSFWFSGELVNYISILPVILSAPPLRGLSLDYLQRIKSLKWEHLLPAITFATSCIVALIIGGPGALAFPVPALLWCGLAYPIFWTSVLTLMFGFWSLMFISAGHQPDLPGKIDEMALASIRLGASLVALAPIILSSVMQSRNALLAELHQIATHDPLTGTSNRGALLEDARKALGKNKRQLAVLMLDLDNFKTINDTYGHAAGDQVLIAFADRVKGVLRPNDLFGRLGGEEFAAIIPDCTPDSARQIGERIRQVIANDAVTLADGQEVQATVSIGVSITPPNVGRSIDELLAEADSVLYLAKRSGRNKLEMAASDSMTPLPCEKMAAVFGPL